MFTFYGSFSLTHTLNTAFPILFSLPGPVQGFWQEKKKKLKKTFRGEKRLGGKGTFKPLKMQCERCVAADWRLCWSEASLFFLLSSCSTLWQLDPWGPRLGPGCSTAQFYCRLVQMEAERQAAASAWKQCTVTYPNSLWRNLHRREVRKVVLNISRNRMICNNYSPSYTIRPPRLLIMDNGCVRSKPHKTFSVPLVLIWFSPCCQQNN